MIDFFEIIKRALNGPYCAEQDFAMKILVPKLRAVVKKYDIKYDPTTPVPSDDKLADDIFQAGLELCAEVGCYCKDTSRIIKFTPEEIAEALRDAPARLGLRRDRDPVAGDRGDDGGLLPRLEDRRLAAGAVSGLGQLRRRAELHHLAAQRWMKYQPLGERRVVTTLLVCWSVIPQIAL